MHLWDTRLHLLCYHSLCTGSCDFPITVSAPAWTSPVLSSHALCFGPQTALMGKARLTGSLPLVSVASWGSQSWMQYPDLGSQVLNTGEEPFPSICWLHSRCCSPVQSCISSLEGHIADWSSACCNVINILLFHWQADPQNVPDWPLTSLYRQQVQIRTWASLSSFYFLYSATLHPLSDRLCPPKPCFKCWQAHSESSSKSRNVSAPWNYFPRIFCSLTTGLGFWAIQSLGEISRETVSFTGVLISLISEDRLFLTTLIPITHSSCKWISRNAARARREQARKTLV